MKILMDEGRLRMSVTALPPTPRAILRQRGSLVEFGSNLKYAPTHHFGDEKRNIPARPFMLFQDEDDKRILKLIRKEFREFDKTHRVKAS